jgi:hypothetical protein
LLKHSVVPDPGYSREDMKNRPRFNSTFTTAFWIWLAVTVLVASSVGVIHQQLGIAGFDAFIHTGPHSILSVTIISVALTWLLAGIYLYLLGTNRLTENNIFKHGGFLLVALMYLNVMREHTDYGDIDYYIEAATNLVKGKPLPDIYFYPPLWATILKYLVVYGDKFILAFTWTLNILALFAFYFLLQRVLEKYGFAPRMAALITTVFMLVNTTILRTLGYMQVNLLMLDFILLGLLSFRRSNFWSALCMALAVYLKASPAVLVLAFILELDWRWMSWAAFHMLWITVLLVWLDGTQPFWDFFNNYANLNKVHVPIYHDTSFDSFFLAIAEFTGLSRQLAVNTAYAAKGIVGIIVLLGIPRVIKNKTFHSGDDNTRLYNSLPLLAILMLTASPLVWEHHGIILTLPFLLLLKRLDAPSDWLWFGLAYLLQYILPTFDFFPWSYGRLFAPLILLWLAIWRSNKESSLFAHWNQWLENIPLPQTP